MMDRVKRTDAMDCHFNIRAHDLVPLVDLEDEPATSLETPSSDERVYEFGVWGEVGVDCLFLFFWTALCELADYAFDFFDWVVHC